MPHVDRTKAMTSLRRRGKTLREIGKQFGVSPERVRQIVRKATREAEARNDHANELRHLRDLVWELEGMVAALESRLNAVTGDPIQHPQWLTHIPTIAAARAMAAPAAVGA